MSRTIVRVTALLCVLLASQPASVLAEDVDAVLAWGSVTTVSIPVDGLVTEVSVQPGDRVAGGEVLIRLSQSTANFALRSAAAELEAAVAELKEAVREKNDAETLYEQTVLSDVELQDALIRYRQIKAKHDRAQVELDRARWWLGWTTLKAPFDARVIESAVVPGQVIAGDVRSRPLMKLAPLTVMRAVADVDAGQLGKRETGESATVTVEGDSYRGRVAAIHARDDVTRYRLVVEFETGTPLWAGDESPYYAAMTMVCRRYLVSGRVQGVFFRDSTRREAQSLALDGWVRNRRDGRVEVLVSGEAETVSQLDKWLHNGPEYAKVTTIERIEEETCREVTGGGFYVETTV